MRISIAYGDDRIPVSVPDDAAVLRAFYPPPVSDSAKAVFTAISSPIGTPPLDEMISSRKPQKACVVVSDQTRPVPNDVILPVLLDVCETAGLSASRVTILVGTGMHRQLADEERRKLVGGRTYERVGSVVDHVATDDSSHRTVGITQSGVTASVDVRYLDADLKIVTGHIEPHFMAGFSGGRKGICPGIVDLATIKEFHGPRLLTNPRSVNGVLDGNPCHAEAASVAEMTGCDFLVNVVLDDEARLVSVVAGDIEEAFATGVAMVESHARVAVPAIPADIVITSGGGGAPLDDTFYQCVKGIVGAIPFVRPGGTMIAAGRCAEGVGSSEFVSLLSRFGANGDAFTRAVSDPDWTVVCDQWQVQMLHRATSKARVVFVSEGLSDVDPGIIPVDIVALSDPGSSLQDVFDRVLLKTESPRVAVVPTGPYVYGVA
jgi:nickel-dependent lactate racemase